MKHLRTALLAVLALTIFAGAADAQKRKPTKKPVKKPVPNATVAPLDVRVAREKVDIQLANVNTFLDKYGPIAQSVEILDKPAAEGRLNQEGIARNEATKKKLLLSIREVKAALLPVETEFRTKPALKNYLSTIDGISDLAAESEDMAIAGKFVAAKDPLREVVKKLTATLALLPR